MKDRFPHPAQVHRDVDRLQTLLAQCSLAAREALDEYEEAYEASLGMSRSGEMPTLGRGFSDSRPTESAAFNPLQRQLRTKARHAASLVRHALADVNEASTQLANGMLSLDPDEWVRAMEKRQAASAPVGDSNIPPTRGGWNNGG